MVDARGSHDSPSPAATRYSSPFAEHAQACRVYHVGQSRRVSEATIDAGRSRATIERVCVAVDAQAPVLPTVDVVHEPPPPRHGGGARRGAIG